MEVSISIVGDEIQVYTPYDPLFTEKLKKAFTSDERRYSNEEKCWYIKYTKENEKLLRKLVNEHFEGAEDRLILFKCTGSSPTINGISVVSFSRDSDVAKRAWNFSVITYKRFPPYGSRKYPEFHGLILVKAKINKATVIKGEFVDFPYSKSLHMTAINLIDSSESVEDYEKIRKSLKEVVDLTEKDQAIAVRGFLVFSSLPSKALLDHSLPKFFEGEKIGNEIIKIVRGYFYNKLGTLSRKFYNDILQKHGIWAGFGYIIPFHKIPEFLKDVDELREEYRQFEKELTEFLKEGKIPEDKLEDKRIKIDPEYVELVKKYLKMHGVKEIQIPDISDRVKIRLIPFSLDFRLIWESIDPKIAQDLERELKEVKKEMVDSILQKLNEKIDSIYERLRDYENKTMNKRVAKKLKEDIEFVLRTAEELNIESDRIENLRKAKEAVDLIVEDKIRVTGRKSRLRALLKQIS